MGFLEQEGFALTSEIKEETLTQILSIRLKPLSGRAPLVFRVEVAGPQVRHTVVIQRGPTDLLIARQMEAERMPREGLERLIPPGADFLHATRFRSSDAEDTYELGLLTTGDFRSPRPDAVIRVGERHEYTDEGDTPFFDSVTDLGDMRFFTVTNLRMGANSIGLPLDLRDFVGNPPQQDLVHAIVFFTYDSSSH